MGRVLLTWELGGGLGHLVNLKPFAQQLSRRGHEVFAALKDVTGAAEVFGNARVAYLQAPICAPGGTHVDLPRTFAEIMHNNGFCDLGSIRSLCQAWRHLYEYVQPDLIVFDHSPMAMLAARGLDAKRVMVGTGFFCPPLSYPLPDLRPALDSDPMELRRCEDAVLARMNDAAAEWGQPPLTFVSDLFSQLDENFLATFAELDHYPEREDARYYGAWPGGIGRPPKWPPGDGKRIYAYLKRFAGLEGLLQSLRELGHPTLIFTDGVDEKLRRRFESEQLRFTNGPIELTRVAKQCDLAILNANHGTTVAMLLAGVPTLQIPRYLEQSLFAAAVVRLGAGLAAPADQPDLIEQHLRTMLADDSFAAAAAQFAQRHADFDPGAQIAEIIERAEQLLVDGTGSRAGNTPPTEWIEPIELVHHRRFDVVAKYLYAKHRHRYGTRCTWAKELYLEHIRVFNGFQEAVPRKKSPDDFLNAFHEVVDSIGDGGFDPTTPPVPIARDGSILNGAHRVAVCLLHGRPVLCQPTNHPGYDFSAGWFGRRRYHVPTGLTAQVADPIALEYCRLRSNTAIVVALPGVTADDQQLSTALLDHSRIVYARKVKVTDVGVENLAKVLQSASSGDLDVQDGSARAFLIEVDEAEALDALTTQLQEVCDGESTVIVSDSHESAVRLTESLLSRTTVDFLNQVYWSNLSDLDAWLDILEHTIRDHAIDRELLCVFGESPKLFHGESFDCGKLRVGVYPDVGPAPTSTAKPRIEIASVADIGPNAEEAIFHHDRHFYYRGIRFATGPFDG